MGLLDAILKQAGGAVLGGGKGGTLGSIADIVAKNPQILGAAVAILNPKDGRVGGSGGLGEVIGAMTKGGLGGAASSWVGTGANQPVDAGALASALGPDIIGQFARQAGLGQADAGSVLAGVLPELVNQLTPQGQVPQGNALDSAIGSLLGQLGGH